jgi:para-aminobenzoate synthetase/4-amino-4-deoxychorismate lyase
MSPPRSTPTALIDFRSPDDGVAPLRLAFGVPRERLCAYTPDAVAPLLARVDALARASAWCVGYLCYEAAGAFDEAFETHAPSDPTRPLASFAVYDAPLADVASFESADTATVRWTGGPQRDAFDTVIAEILRAIADGEVYQVNATAPLTGTLQGEPLALFAALRRAQPNAYAAYLDFGSDAAPDDRILSVSPELFFDWRADRLLARPMKGTAPRGATPEDDAAQSRFLRSAAKERAENLMIVDLLRNDLSRVAEPHSVHVPRLFHTEAWPTVWQMSSDVVARTRPGTTLADVFAALFPCGSITGAPKVQAMRLINDLEPEPRGIYCGAIGVVQPGGVATFNVPIRTLALRTHGDATQVRCGIGSLNGPARRSSCWRRCGWTRASSSTSRRISRAWTTPHVTSRSPRRWLRPVRRWPRCAPRTRAGAGACACLRIARAPRARRRSSSPPRRSPCACNSPSGRWSAATASSCASRRRTVRTTTPSRRPTSACSTRCCGTSMAS